ncbi:hypothetical protein C440_16264 [Haloferax mucosum ATCC BAA-1512]|uniref:DUF4013 domain-containing protein n=1 Tax=Haloferax mucosum ATCC BAA-1512 TaxID=662479 RepID=M0I7P7_9EURY|nr:DUF4013 domain-containing protein [Haloferax mucosum]ELZ91883.1 hypothetical protein C440_16264 [Haloferax mucosum ATCC BAA-1512]
MDASDFESAFTLPLAEDTSFDTFVVGLLVTLASFATPLAGVLLVGYVVRLVRGGDRRATALPSFDDFPGIVAEGVRLSVALVTLQLPAVGILAVVFNSSRLSLTALALSTPRALRYFDFSVLDVVGLVVAAVVALVGTYLSAAATVAIARERSLLAATPVFRDLAFDVSFVPVVSAVALVGFAGRIAVLLFGAFPLGGVILAGTVSFLVLVASATLLGRGAPATPAGDACSGTSTKTDTTDPV